jgi:hypothetical protein
MTPAEIAIRNAILEVEKVGADIRLTDAVCLLEKAKNKVADFVDGVETPKVIVTQESFTNA